MNSKILLPVLFSLFLFSQIAHTQTGWFVQNSGTNSFLYDVCFVDQNTGWVCGHLGTILYTSDGGDNWNDLNPPPSNFYSAIDFVNQNEGWVVGYAGITRHSTDGGLTWTEQSIPTGRGLSNLYFINENTGWGIGGKPRTFTDPIRDILHTTDGGTNWTIQYTGNDEDPLASVYFLDENFGWAVGSMSTIMKTTNGGNTWITQMSGNGYQFSDVQFVNPDTGWVVGQDLSVQHYAVIFNTIDGGATWDIQTFGSDDSFSAVQFVNESMGWVIGGNNDAAIIRHTSDGGDNWIPQTPNTTNLLSDVCFVDENKGWAVGFDGTIIHTDNTVPVELNSFSASVSQSDVTLSWKTATETNNSGFEIQKSDVRDQESEIIDWKKIGFIKGNGTSTNENHYSYIDKNLKSGRYSYKLVQIDFDGTRTESEVINVEINYQPKEYALMQNYPNPFNPATTIEYSIAVDGNAKLKIFNTLGEEVKTLVNEYKTAGSYKINFDASALPSGVYYYKIETGRFTSVKKMILLR